MFRGQHWLELPTTIFACLRATRKLPASVVWRPADWPQLSIPETAKMGQKSGCGTLRCWRNPTAAHVLEVGLWDREADELPDYVGIAGYTTGVVLVAGPKSNGRLPTFGTHVAPRWPYQTDKSIPTTHRHQRPEINPGKHDAAIPRVRYFFLVEAARWSAFDSGLEPQTLSDGTASACNSYRRPKRRGTRKVSNADLLLKACKKTLGVRGLSARRRSGKTIIQFPL
jgi:hypothetical protein